MPLKKVYFETVNHSSVFVDKAIQIPAYFFSFYNFESFCS